MDGLGGYTGKFFVVGVPLKIGALGRWGVGALGRWGVPQSQQKKKKVFNFSTLFHVKHFSLFSFLTFFIVSRETFFRPRSTIRVQNQGASYG